MENKKIIGALIGLIGAMENNGNTDTEDVLILEALREEDNEEMLRLIEEERDRLSPSCKTCPNPCGNTSAYDLKKMKGDAPAIQRRKEEIIRELTSLAKRRQTGPVPKSVFKALSALKFEFGEDYYEKLLGELRNDP